MNRYISFLKKYFLLSSITVLLFSASCQKSDAPAPIPPRTRDTSRVPGNPASNTAVNTWITDSMRIYYYWNESIPKDDLLNLKLAPPDFFESILDDADRFSWIQNVDDLNDNLAGVSTTTGLNIMLVSYNDDKNVLGVVRYVIPGSPADNLGIKRGVLFSEINGTTMTPGNYETLLDPYFNGESFQITLATIENDVVKEGNKVNLSVTRVDEPSVYYHKIFTTNSGKEVGYIFYNRFLNEKADELFSVFNEFKSSGVNELILDLRYNLGGGISVSGVLAALIKQSYNKDQIFVNYNYNKLFNALIPLEERNDSFAKLFPAVSNIQNTDNAISDIDSKVKNANLNLPKVYILGTYNSASASELVIHNLAPYMQVIHIGETTRGKNEGSITIEDKRTPRVINWALQPIIVKLADKNGEGDYDQGLIPDYEVDETDVLPLLPIGSEQDPLVAKALSLIDPISSPQARARTMAITPTPLLQKVSFANKFDERTMKAKPVQVDGTIDTETLKKIKEEK
ncbi:C-terminal processing protease CtpA/Prc [Albibacterium bauzanense]|uniref:C-terminal processing protease CtpA/Prc n=2 Tax=Albibacterium bauzanense TaxID=653929 RepID=A0A4R1LVH6_9SPHI|nr:C-terminal processing protease CtpA/Prc [Albibacterium bauzanense]